MVKIKTTRNEMNCVKNVEDIKAHVITSWDHPNAKFKPGDVVRVHLGEGGVQEARIGDNGKIVAVSATVSGKIRGDYGLVTTPEGREEYQSRRMYTRYYVQFGDECILGFHSHFLKKLERDDAAKDLSDFNL